MSALGYFEFNATAPLRPEAREAWLQAADEHWHNPGSPVRSGARVRALLEGARERLGELLGVAPKRIVFTSGATEANNLVLRHYAADTEVWVSSVEHPSVLEPARARFGERLRILGVDTNGVVQVPEFTGARPGLVSIMAANNETGVCQPWRDLAGACAQAGVSYHCDAVQWLGKQPAEGFAECAWVTGSGHKFGGPKGVGFLLIPDGAPVRGQLGGAQEHGHRGGTENYPAVAALVAALEAAVAEDFCARGACRDAFEAHVCKAIPGTRANGAGAARLPQTSSLTLPYGENTRWILKLDRRGFQVSSGSACATAKESPSHVLGAMGVSREEIRRTVRVSGGTGTTEAAWKALAAAFCEVAAEIGGAQAPVIEI